MIMFFHFGFFSSVKGDKLLSFSYDIDHPICLSAWQTTVSFVTDGTNVFQNIVLLVREVVARLGSISNGLHNNIAHLKLRSIALSICMY